MFAWMITFSMLTLICIIGACLADAGKDYILCLFLGVFYAISAILMFRYWRIGVEERVKE